MKFTTTLDAPLTIEQLAGLFADLDDDSQAKFFVEAARLLGSQHVRDCACSTEEAREFLTAIVEAMQPTARECARGRANRREPSIQCGMGTGLRT